MSHHGTVCFGQNDTDTFERALALENDSRNYIGKIFEETSGKKLNSEKEIYSLYIGGESRFPQKVLKLGSSKRTENGFVLSLNGQETAYKLEQKALPQEASIHAEIYRKRKDLNYITYADSAPLVAVAAAKTPLVAILDDFAQIEGRRACCSKSEKSEDVVRALGKRAGVIIPGSGALCCGATESDAHAVLLVMEKNAYAQIAASLTGKPKNLSIIDCAVMRAVYKLSYSKKE
jgi:ribulose-5-phosphate 4-epimerase/fuculose-1-phosphate aldolase